MPPQLSQVFTARGSEAFFPHAGTLGCATVSGGGVREGTMRLVQLSTGFQSLPPLPTSKLGPSSGDSWVGGFVYVLGPGGSLQ